MFERALIRRIDGSDIDIGMIAETIFFYGKTHLLLDRGSLLGITKALSVSDLERLLESGTVQLSYKTGSLGVVSAGCPNPALFRSAKPAYSSPHDNAHCMPIRMPFGIPKYGLKHNDSATQSVGLTAPRDTFMVKTLAKLKRAQITAKRHPHRITSFDQWHAGRSS